MRGILLASAAVVGLLSAVENAQAWGRCRRVYVAGSAAMVVPVSVVGGGVTTGGGVGVIGQGTTPAPAFLGLNTLALSPFFNQGTVTNGLFYDTNALWGGLNTSSLGLNFVSPNFLVAPTTPSNSLLLIPPGGAGVDNSELTKLHQAIRSLNQTMASLNISSLTDQIGVPPTNPFDVSATLAEAEKHRLASMRADQQMQNSKNLAINAYQRAQAIHDQNTQRLSDMKAALGLPK